MLFQKKKNKYVYCGYELFLLLFLLYNRENILYFVHMKVKKSDMNFKSLNISVTVSMSTVVVFTVQTLHKFILTALSLPLNNNKTDKKDSKIIYNVLELVMRMRFPMNLMILVIWCCLHNSFNEWKNVLVELESDSIDPIGMDLLYLVLCIQSSTAWQSVESEVALFFTTITFHIFYSLNYRKFFFYTYIEDIKSYYARIQNNF